MVIIFYIFVKGMRCSQSVRKHCSHCSSAICSLSTSGKSSFSLARTTPRQPTYLPDHPPSFVVSQASIASRDSLCCRQPCICSRRVATSESSAELDQLRSPNSNLSMQPSFDLPSQQACASGSSRSPDSFSPITSSCVRCCSTYKIQGIVRPSHQYFWNHHSSYRTSSCSSCRRLCSTGSCDGLTFDNF